MAAAEAQPPSPSHDEEFSDEEELDWILGFVEPPSSPESLLRHRFPSKVGGRPAWLDPVRLPQPAQLAGPSGNAPLSFLLQVRSLRGCHGARRAMHA